MTKINLSAVFGFAFLIHWADARKEVIGKNAWWIIENTTIDELKSVLRHGFIDMKDLRNLKRKKSV